MVIGTRSIRAIVALATALLCIGLAAAPVGAQAQVTSGEFGPLDVPALEVGGHATMVRTADGRTKIDAHVEGLEPGRTYPAHVHNLPCGTSRGGGHYQDTAGAGTTPPNELWPSDDPRDPLAKITANDAGVARGNGTAEWTARAEAQSVVIHQWDDAAVRIACADLV